MDPAEEISRILGEAKRIAVVGLSPRPERDSHRVAAYLQQAGYRILPVNPGADEILGERCYATLSEVPPSTAGTCSTPTFSPPRLWGSVGDAVSRTAARSSSSVGFILQIYHR